MYIRKLYEVSHNTSLKRDNKRLYIELDWRVARLVLKLNLPMKQEMIVSHSVFMHEITHWNSLFLDRLKKSSIDMSLLIKSSENFYEDMIKHSKWKNIYISRQAIEGTKTDINKEIGLGKIEEFLKTSKFRVFK
jgi:hypothetical protein